MLALLALVAAPAVLPFLPAPGMRPLVPLPPLPGVTPVGQGSAFSKQHGRLDVVPHRLPER